MSKSQPAPQDKVFEQLLMKSWKDLWPMEPEPEQIEILQKRRRSRVYRLKAAGHNGTDLVAKRSRLAKANVENMIYGSILPQLEIPALSCYGFVECSANMNMYMMDMDEANRAVKGFT